MAHNDPKKPTNVPDSIVDDIGKHEESDFNEAGVEEEDLDEDDDDLDTSDFD